MIERALGALRTVCDDVVVVSSRHETPTGGWSTIPDLRAGLGPLAGIEAALDHAARTGHGAVLLLACDLPLVDARVLSALVQAFDGREPVAIARDGEPHYEPLCALYPADCLATATALLDRGEKAARALFAEGGRVVALGSEGGAGQESASAMLNVNTPADAVRARALIDRDES